jgi:hypothetical protein
MHTTRNATPTHTPSAPNSPSTSASASASTNLTYTCVYRKHPDAALWHRLHHVWLVTSGLSCGTPRSPLHVFPSLKRRADWDSEGDSRGANYLAQLTLDRTAPHSPHRTHRTALTAPYCAATDSSAWQRRQNQVEHKPYHQPMQDPIPATTGWVPSEPSDR